MKKVYMENNYFTEDSFIIVLIGQVIVASITAL